MSFPAAARVIQGPPPILEGLSQGPEVLGGVDSAPALKEVSMRLGTYHGMQVAYTQEEQESMMDALRAWCGRASSRKGHIVWFEEPYMTKGGYWRTRVYWYAGSSRYTMRLYYGFQFVKGQGFPARWRAS